MRGLIALWASTIPAIAAGAGLPYFVDIAAEAGVVAPTWCGRDDKPHIMESNGTGLGLVDYDSDGDLDLYLVNGWRLDGEEIAERGRDVLYRNEGQGQFLDVTEAAGLGSDAWGSGLATGDANGDGLVDLFVTNFGTDVLYLNRGDGTFEEHPDSPNLEGWSAGAVFFDSDGDGDEDLYVGGYIECTLEEVLTEKPSLVWEGIDVMLGPFGLEGLGNKYFRNEGGGRFEEATEEAGLEDVGLFYTFGILAADLDSDLDLDIYAANDSNPNYLYSNDGGVFQEVGLWSGAALDEGGAAQAGMGLAAGDVESDGLVDLLVTNFQQDMSTLYRNLGDMIFEDVTRSVQLGGPTFSMLSWGTTLSDLDQDGDLDIFVANGHIYPQADLVADKVGGGFRQANLLLVDQGGTLIDVSSEAGPGLAVKEVSHGLAVGDIDFDGDLDLAISNVDEPPTLLRNDTREPGSYLLVDAPLALRVEAVHGDDRWIRHRVIGGSFLSVNDPRFHFGFGEKRRLESLTLIWPDGFRRRLLDVPVNYALKIER
ncbi:MAG: CRTAC1 family protein [Thermoanaerobaculia bacterium]